MHSVSYFRCCIEAVQDETVWARWIDCGTLLEVPKQSLTPLTVDYIYPPGAVRATLLNFSPEDMESASEDLAKVLLSLKDLQIFFLDSRDEAGVIIFTENFTEVKLETLDHLKSLCLDGEC